MQTGTGLCPNTLERKAGSGQTVRTATTEKPWDRQKAVLMAAFHLGLSPALQAGCHCSHFIAGETEAQRG